MNSQVKLSQLVEQTRSQGIEVIDDISTASVQAAAEAIELPTLAPSPFNRLSSFCSDLWTGARNKGAQAVKFVEPTVTKVHDAVVSGSEKVANTTRRANAHMTRFYKSVKARTSNVMTKTPGWFQTSVGFVGDCLRAAGSFVFRTCRATVSSASFAVAAAVLGLFVGARAGWDPDTVHAPVIIANGANGTTTSVATDTDAYMKVAKVVSSASGFYVGLAITAVIAIAIAFWIAPTSALFAWQHGWISTATLFAVLV